ncbi:MAG: outer membrane lipoprotein carrier protein LolA, partial [Alphaproteobacteria bacterium]|nr:outer membrane lipoprotein carrier protein LolA [Alphaproteobacteria bacterium]
ARAQDAAEIARVEAYLNAITTMSAEFTQIAPDGRTSDGRFLLFRPGRLRFEYKPPAKTLVVADGFRIVYQDPELGQSTQVPIAQTPLSVLLDPKVDLRNGRVTATRVDKRPGVLRLTVQDRKAPEQGFLVLEFADNPLVLRNWRVTDAQGQTTAITLSDLRFGETFRLDLFLVLETFPGDRTR